MIDSEQQHLQLIELFKRYLAKDQSVIDAIQNFGRSFCLDNASWQFTQPDLFEFSRRMIPAISTLQYQQFRQLLYQYPTNQMVSADQGLFELKENKGHVDKNIYQLSHLRQADV